MKSMKTWIAAALALVLAPTAALAAEITSIDSLATKFTNIGNLAITILISLAVLWIIVNVVRYLIIGAADPASRATAGHAIIWGIVGLFIILSIWGLVKILTTTFSTENNVPTQDFPEIIPPPQV